VKPNPTEAESYAIYMGAVTEYVRAHPLSPILSMPAKAWNMLRPTFGGARLVTFIVLGLTWIALLLLAVIGTWRGGLHEPVAFVWAYVVVLFAVHLLTIAEIRYRMPIEAMLAIPAGTGVAWAYGRLRPSPA
jgi:hypothetical protein